MAGRTTLLGPKSSEEPQFCSYCSATLDEQHVPLDNGPQDNDPQVNSSQYTFRFNAVLAKWGKGGCGIPSKLNPLRIQKICLKQGEIHVCQRQRPSRLQAPGSRSARRAFSCTGNPKRIQIPEGDRDLRGSRAGRLYLPSR